MYTRVFASILDSSINVQSVPPAVRWLWITMMVIADENRTGIVDMPVERLAARAGLSIEDTRRGLSILSAPDTESSSPEEDGRRLVPIRADATRGWKLVNWDKYRQIATAEHQRDMTRKRVQAHRIKGRNVTGRNKVQRGGNTSEAATEASATTKNLFPSPPSETPKKKVHQGKHKLPEDWQPSPELRQELIAKYPHHPFDETFASFRRNHIGKETKWARWDLALENWFADRFVSNTRKPQQPERRVIKRAPSE